MYHDDAILEFPQSGERFRGKANMQGFREEYQQFNSTSSRARSGEAGTSGSGRAGRCMTGANPVHFVHILEFRGDLVQRESIYFAEPFPAPE